MKIEDDLSEDENTPKININDKIMSPVGIAWTENFDVSASIHKEKPSEGP